MRSHQLSTRQLRRAIRLAYANGAIWAVGNGLTSTTLVVYLAIELGAAGLAIGLLVAAPPLVGVLRQAAPVLIGRLASRKRFCLACFLSSGLLLCALPMLARPDLLPSPAASLTALVVLWICWNTWAWSLCGRGWAIWCPGEFAAGLSAGVNVG